MNGALLKIGIVKVGWEGGGMGWQRFCEINLRDIISVAEQEPIFSSFVTESRSRLFKCGSGTIF